jgi:hypothetical protein
VGALNADAKVGSLNQWHELPAEILNGVDEVSRGRVVSALKLVGGISELRLLEFWQSNYNRIKPPHVRLATGGDQL